jgi:hypothetical protein
LLVCGNAAEVLLPQLGGSRDLLVEVMQFSAGKALEVVPENLLESLVVLLAGGQLAHPQRA